MATETALVDLSVWSAIEWEAHALQLDHRRDRLASQHFGGILVGEIVATLDGVEHVPLPVILFHIAECGTDAALCSARVRSRWIQLREHRCWNAFTSELEGSPEASAARANNDRIYINLPRLYSKCATHFSS
jgi:hypothetical protein